MRHPPGLLDTPDMRSVQFQFLVHCMTNVQSNDELVDIDIDETAASAAALDGYVVDGADGRTGGGHQHSRTNRGEFDLDTDSEGHRRLPPSVPEMQHLVTSLQLELEQSQATQMRTR